MVSEGKVEEVRDLIAGVELFSRLKEREIDIVAENIGIYTYGEGDSILEQGKPCDGIYVIRSGSVIIQKESEEGTLDLARFIKGESFGEMDFLQGTDMNASALADTDTEVLVFPERGKSFQDVLDRYPEISAHLLHEFLALVAGRIRSTNSLISEKSQWVQNLKRQLLTDKLTGLYNRTFLEEEFATLLPEYGDGTAIIMIKPDAFKRINDTYGHEVGDAVLTLMADILKRTIGDEDVGVRYRGNEYGIIVPGAGESAALQRAEKVRDALMRMDLKEYTGGEDLKVTFSIGIAIYPGDGEDNKELAKSAFERMFSVLEAGGDRIEMGGQDG
jgi:diguanylate cyclase (GGDEF)-like protein